MSLRRPTNAGSNSSPTTFTPKGASTDRYCMKCQCWRPSKGGRLMPVTRLWICSLEHKAKTT